jgi:Sigma-70, region 4
LPRRQREAIALQHYARLPESETARAIGLSVGAVKAHTAHGMAALQTALTPDGYDGRLGMDLECPLRIWVRDSSGRWHATRPHGWAGADHSEVTMRLQVLPPLSRAATWIDVLAAGHSAEVRVTLPLRWQ